MFSIFECVGAVLKAIDTSLKNLKLEYAFVIDISVEPTLQLISDVGLFNIFDNKNYIFRECFTFIRKRRQK